MGTEGIHPVSNLTDEQAAFRMICHRGRAWHGRHLRFSRVLDENYAAVFLDCPRSCGPVATSTAQHDTHDPLTVGFGGRNEKGIGGGPGVMDFRPLIQTDAMRLQRHMMVGRCHVDMPSLDQSAITTENCRVAATTPQ
jgi:hypothetical protein